MRRADQPQLLGVEQHHTAKPNPENRKREETFHEAHAL